MKKAVVCITGFLLLSLAFSACGGRTAGTDSAALQGKSQKIIFALQNVPDGLDPGITNNSFAAPFLFNLFEGLITYDKDNNIIPALAESWTISDDGTVYTFRLRAGLKWSDGSPLTARDFVYSYFRVLDPKVAAQYSVMFTDFVKGAEEYYNGTGSRDQVGIAAPDDNTLILTLKGPTPFFLGILGMWTFSPVKQAVVDQEGERWTLSANTFVSNGPFKVSDIKLGESVTAVKNEYYWDAANVRLEEIVFRYILEPATALTALEAGEIDGLRFPPASETARLKSQSDAFRAVPSFATTYYLINRNVKPFDDVRVRKALSMAIDREDIISNVLQSSDTPAFGLVSPGYVLDGEDFRDGRPNYGLSSTADVEGARKLLAEAGYPDGQGFPTIQLSYYTDRTVRSIVEALQQMWKKNLNINTEISTQEWAVYYDAVQRMDYQIGAMGWGGDYLHPMTFLTTMTSNNPTNVTSYSNAQYDALVAAAQMEVDPVKAVALMQEAEDMAMEDVSILPLYHRSIVFMMAPHVKDFYMTPLANLYFRSAYVE
ncbi:MAG: peptide ABC transporter substrate-binding protein [Spirochaetaceae bacterium]|jgi:oligopeptide transport system substrate-binding protein|nr:peptide ABC transporter substrate-binding protein [Spirochaetaceae bacterium]